MEHRFNAFNDIPRGAHWLGKSTTSGTPSSDSFGDKPRSATGYNSYLHEESTTRSPEGDPGISFLRHRGVGPSTPRFDRKVPNTEAGKRKGLPRIDREHLPLISTEILDIPKQRMLALTIFVIIQLYKMYDLVLLKSGIPVSGLFLHRYRLNFISKYVVADSLFLYFLPTFRIPWLNFRRSLVFLQIVSMTALTFFLSSKHDFYFLSLLITGIRRTLFSKKLTLSGNRINEQQRVVDLSSHFQGALTIKILPENTAMLNPLHESYCLPFDLENSWAHSRSDYNGGAIEVPIRINSTDEIKQIQLEFRDLYTNSMELRNLTERDFKKIDDPTYLLRRDKLFPEDKSRLMAAQKGDQEKRKAGSIRYISIPIKEVGFYQIREIRDSKGLRLKVYQSHLIVPHCPTANVVGSGSPDRCLGDSDKISIEILGVPPLKLSYSKMINDKVYSFVDTDLQPESFKSPLQQSTLINKKFVFSSDDLSHLEWARSHPVAVNFDTPTTLEGHYVYRIEKLVDGLGNTLDISGMSDKLKKNQDLLNEFTVHSIPKASLDEKFDPKSPTKRSIVVKFESFPNWKDDIPFYFNVSYSGGSNGQQKDVQLLELSSYDLTYVFPAEKPGTYTLEHAKSRYCRGGITGRSSVTISEPIPPRLEVSAKPVLDQCIGQVGLDFDLTFTGIPPFYYNVLVYKLGDSGNSKRSLISSKRKTSKGSRNQFTYNSPSEGKYEIVFDQLSNDLFTDPISLAPSENYTFKTSMRVKPSASLEKPWGSPKPVTLCLGQTVKIPVNFRGEVPFTLKYDILEASTNKRTSYEIKDIKDYRAEIQTPKFETGGEYILTLASLTDASNCLVSLSEPDVRIKVRRDVPSASFEHHERDSYRKNELYIKQGSMVDIPLRLAGEAPFVVRYQHLDFNGKVLDTRENTFHSNYRPSLKLDKEGIYKLIEMKDSACEGKIVNKERTYKIKFLERPGFVIKEGKPGLTPVKKVSGLMYASSPVCRNVEGAIDLQLYGSPPFILNYDLTTPDGRVLNRRIQVATKYASLKLPNDVPGEYTLRVKSIWDSNYEEGDFTSESGSEDLVIRQMVNPLPGVRFARQGKTFRTCLADDAQSWSSDPIQLKFLSGLAPFTMTFNIYHESTGRSDQITIRDITRDNFPYERLYSGLKLGNHIVTIEKIVDANGCVADLSNIQLDQISNLNDGSMDGARNMKEVADDDPIRRGTYNNNHIFISVTDVPKIRLSDPDMEYCVGDYVSYQLNGIAPFIIKYDFNGMKLKSKEESSQFVRLASEPGNISILSLRDSTSQCVVNFTRPGMEEEFKRLSLTIHPIPSVKVSRGDYIIEDIHEGDQAELVFTFEGTPPFSLTYVRTEESEADGNEIGFRRAQVVETHKVTDIYDYEYRVMTSLQGTYEAIEISDAYCFAKNDAFFRN